MVELELGMCTPETKKADEKSLWVFPNLTGGGPDSILFCSVGPARFRETGWGSDISGIDFIEKKEAPIMMRLFAARWRLLWWMLLCSPAACSMSASENDEISDSETDSNTDSAVDSSVDSFSDAGTDTWMSDSTTTDSASDVLDSDSLIFDTFSDGATTDSSSMESDTSPLTFVSEPLFRGNENPDAPLSGVLTLETSRHADIIIDVIGDDGDQWTIYRTATPRLEIPIIGLKADILYSVFVTANAGGDSVAQSAGEWTTPALPADFPPLDILISEPDIMEPGMMMVNVWNGVSSDAKPLIILDNAGNVRWYYDGAPAIDDHHLLPDGHVLFSPDECLIYEVDMLGNLVRAWEATNHPVDCDAPDGAIPVPVESFHHAMSILNNGNVLALSSEVREIADFPGSEDDTDVPTETVQVFGCVVVEFTTEGEIVKQIPLLDILDPTRIGRGVLDESWSLVNKYRENGERPKDWDHANALVYDEASDAYIVSVRHQDAVIKINREDESLEWIMGTPANWKSPWLEKLLQPEGEMEWFYHQHAVTVTDEGIGMYDNGNFRASAFEPEQEEYSRAVLFDVNEITHTVSQVWSFGAPDGEDFFYTEAMGSAEWQPVTGNVLIGNGWMAGGGAGIYTRALEVTPDGNRVFEMLVEGNRDDNNTRYASHRVRRIPDIRQ